MLLTAQLLVSMPAFAMEIDLQAIEAKCREQMGLDETNGSQSYTRSEVGFEVPEVQQAIIFRLRRCITRQKQAAETEMYHEQRMMRLDQHFWRNYDASQQILDRANKAFDESLKRQATRRANLVGTDRKADRQKIIDAHSVLREEIRRKEIQSRQIANSKEMTISKVREQCTGLSGVDRRACLRTILREPGTE